MNEIYGMNISYDTSFMNRIKVVMDGDVETNPGPCSSIECYSAAIGRHNRSKQVQKRQVSNDFTCIIDVIKTFCLLTFIGVPF